MRQWVLRFLLPALSAATPALADTPVSGYMDCARAIGVAISDKLAVIPADRGGDKGLYLFTDRNAWFLPLGAPDVEQGEAAEFFVRTRISAVGEIFLVYRDRSAGSRGNIQPAIGYLDRLPGLDTLGSYRYATAVDTRGDHAIDAMRIKLVEKIAKVRDFLTEKHRYSPPAEAQAGFLADRKVYVARLERCRLGGDRELNRVVAEEERKLSQGFTGVTVWEKQVSSR